MKKFTDTWIDKKKDWGRFARATTANENRYFSFIRDNKSAKTSQFFRDLNAVTGNKVSRVIVHGGKI